MYDLMTPENPLHFPIRLVEITLHATRRDEKLVKVAHYAVRRWLMSVLDDKWLDYWRGSRVQPIKFVDYRLTETERSHAEELAIAEDDSLLLSLNEIITSGYRITCVQDFENNCTVVSLIGKASDNPNLGKCMTTRHKDLRLALACAVVKQFEVFSNKSWDDGEMHANYG